MERKKYLKIITIEHYCSSRRKKVCLLVDEIKEVMKKHYHRDKLRIEVYD